MRITIDDVPNDTSIQINISVNPDGVQVTRIKNHQPNQVVKEVKEVKDLKETSEEKSKELPVPPEMNFQF